MQLGKMSLRGGTVASNSQWILCGLSFHAFPEAWKLDLRTWMSSCSWDYKNGLNLSQNRTKLLRHLISWSWLWTYCLSQRIVRYGVSVVSPLGVKTSKATYDFWLGVLNLWFHGLLITRSNVHFCACCCPYVWQSSSLHILACTADGDCNVAAKHPTEFSGAVASTSNHSHLMKLKAIQEKKDSCHFTKQKLKAENKY